MKKNLIYISTFLIIISTILLYSKSTTYELNKRLNMISAGSYAFAEVYNLPYSASDVIKAIEKFKENNPEYKTPKVTINNSGSFPLEDSISENKLFFIVYFYAPIKNRIFNIAIQGNKTNTDLIFNSINTNLDLGNWKHVNKDFSYDENEKLKKEFENNYLNPIKKILKNN